MGDDVTDDVMGDVMGDVMNDVTFSFTDEQNYSSEKVKFFQYIKSDTFKHLCQRAMYYLF